MECGAWQENIELMATAMPLCADKEGLVYAHLANSLGCNEYERGHTEVASEYVRKSLEIRQRLLPPNHEEIANSLNNWGNVVLQSGRAEDCVRAIEYWKTCVSILTTTPKDHRDRFLHIPYINMSKALRVMGDCQGSIKNAEQSRDYAIAFLGEGNHFHGL